MQTPDTAPTVGPTSGRVWTRSFVRHFLEMVAAMFVGMLVLDPLWMFVLPMLGATVVLDRIELHVLLMATNMTIGMALWMRHRGHGRVPIAEMSAAMYLPFIVLFPALWTGLISDGALFVLGHVLMLPAMLGVMLLRPAEYAGHHGHG